MGDLASVQAATRVNVEQASKRVMWKPGNAGGYFKAGAGKADISLRKWDSTDKKMFHVEQLRLRCTAGGQISANPVSV